MTGGWRPALRMARRDARRARGRSALIVAMIALPVLGMTVVDVLLRTGQLDPDERVAFKIGATQARLEQLDGGKVLQEPDPDAGLTTSGEEIPGAVEPGSLRALAPAGLRVLGERSGSVQTTTRGGVGTVGWSEVAAGDPAFNGRFATLEGRAARAPGEVAVSPELLERLGILVGEQVELTEPARAVRVTGVVEEPLAGSAETFFAPPGALGGDDERLGDERLYLAGSRPVTWDDVLALNERGVAVLSRSVMLDPPARSAVPLYRATEGFEADPDPVLYIGVALVIALATLEVVLLAGAAFAVGARRQARSLALIAACGGEERHLRRVVLGGGLVLGVAGALTGVIAGIAIAAIAVPLLGDLSDTAMGRFDLRPLEIGAIALTGTITGLLAAVLPARLAGRQDPLQALTGRRGSVSTPRKAPLLGVLVCVAGVAGSALGSALALSSSTGLTAAVVLIAGGAVLTQLGLIACSPAIIGTCGRWARRLPLAPRLAMRDAARHRGRSAPALAAVLTAVAASTALALFVTATDDQDRRAYTPSWPERTAGVSLFSFEQDPGNADRSRVVAFDAQRILDRVAPKLPTFEPTVVDVESSRRCTDVCPTAQLSPPGASHDGEGYSNWGGTPVGGVDVLRATTGTSSPAAAATLAAGGVVVTERRFLVGQRVPFEVVGVAEQRRAIEQGGEPSGRSVRLPATYLDAPDATVSVVYSPAAARELGLEVVPGTLALRFTGRLPSADEEDAAQAALVNAGIEASMTVERGYQSEYGIGLLALALGAALITLGAAGIATGLAQADARDDHATLAAIGAAPRVRRTLAAAQSLTIAALGTTLGVLAGFVPALALIGAVDSLDLVVPWTLLAAVVTGVPLLAAAAAWLLTRSRLPLRARIA